MMISFKHLVAGQLGRCCALAFPERDQRDQRDERDGSGGYIRGLPSIHDQLTKDRQLHRVAISPALCKDPYISLWLRRMREILVPGKPGKPVLSRLFDKILAARMKWALGRICGDLLLVGCLRRLPNADSGAGDVFLDTASRNRREVFNRCRHVQLVEGHQAVVLRLVSLQNETRPPRMSLAHSMN